jgi:pimeloyl-ACP methyl ester carboxylesterase
MVERKPKESRASVKALWKTLLVLAVILGALGAAALAQRTGIGAIEAAHQPSGQFVNVKGGRLHLVALGERDKPVIVLLHGSSANLEDMRLALAPSLSAQYHVVLVDRPGHGWSDRPDGVADASPLRQAQLIHEALEQLGISQAMIVAHSWAAAVALSYALAYQQSVTGLVLLAPLAYPRPPSVAWHDNVISALLAQSARIADSPVFGAFFSRTLLYPLGELLLRAAVRGAFAPQQPVPDYIERAAAELLLRPDAFICNGQDLSSIDDFLAKQEQNYRKISVPVSIIAGDADIVVSTDANARRLATVLPHASLTVLPSVGHMVQFAAPDRIVDAAAAILRARSGPSAPK